LERGSFTTLASFQPRLHLTSNLPRYHQFTTQAARQFPPSVRNCVEHEVEVREGQVTCSCHNTIGTSTHSIRGQKAVITALSKHVLLLTLKPRSRYLFTFRASLSPFFCPYPYYKDVIPTPLITGLASCCAFEYMCCGFNEERDAGRSRGISTAARSSRPSIPTFRPS